MKAVLQPTSLFWLGLNEGNLSSASTVLSTCATTTPQKYFYRVLQIIFESKQTGAYPNLSASHLQELQQMATDENTCGSTQARAMLSRLTEVEFPMNINSENVELRRLEHTSKLSSTLAFRVQPNPANNTAWINFPFNSDMEKAILSVTDIAGKSVFVQNIAGGRGVFELNTSSIPNGIYLVQLVLVIGQLKKTHHI